MQRKLKKFISIILFYQKHIQQGNDTFDLSKLVEYVRGKYIKHVKVLVKSYFKNHQYFVLHFQRSNEVRTQKPFNKCHLKFLCVCGNET